MGDLREYWQAQKEYMKDKRLKEGWISNKYKDEDARNRAISSASKFNFNSDMATEKILIKMGYKATYKSASSFQIELKNGKVMLYSSYKNGTFVYIPKLNKRLPVSCDLDYINNVLEEADELLVPTPIQK